MLGVSLIICFIASLANAQLNELRDTALPTLYEWMERNSYICETNGVRFLNDAEALQSNCEERCGDPLDTLRACSHTSQTSTNEEPKCEPVPELCAREFIQEFILLLRQKRVNLIHKAFNDDQNVLLPVNQQPSTDDETAGNTKQSVTITEITTTSTTSPTDGLSSLLLSKATKAKAIDTTTVTQKHLVDNDAESPTVNSTTDVDGVNDTVSSNKTVFKNKLQTVLHAKPTVVDGEVNDGGTRSVIVNKLLGRFQSVISRTSRPESRVVPSVFKDECAVAVKDDDASCGFWAALNECVKNPTFMKRVCRRSCGVCDKELRVETSDEIRAV